MIRRSNHLLPRAWRVLSSPAWTTRVLAACAFASWGCATMGGGAPSGSDEKPDESEESAMSTIGGKVKGQIVWSSSRVGNHDLFVMNTDGSKIHAITKGENVDWFPRYSPDGKRILFTRSKKGWVFERDANTDGKWDIYSITPEGKDLNKVVENASWGTWINNDEIIFARNTAIIRRPLDGDEETVLVDSAKVPELDGALMQQPEMSKDGRFIAITLRGSKRETGIWDLKKKIWIRTGDGCQINWTPSGEEVYWVHPTGNGGSRVLHMPVANGKAKGGDDLERLTLIDIPGRRSHEYFPQLSRDGKWLVWAATQRGHDHDVADYEIYLWEVGTSAESAVRLTYHSGNDRWPDIFIPGTESSGGSSAEPSSSGGGGGEKSAPASGGNDDEDDDSSSSSGAGADEDSGGADDSKAKPGKSKKHGKKKGKKKKK